MSSEELCMWLFAYLVMTCDSKSQSYGETESMTKFCSDIKETVEVLRVCLEILVFEKLV